MNTTLSTTTTVDVSTATQLLAGSALALSVAFALSALSRVTDPTHAPDGTTLRRIHTLENNSVVFGDLIERVENGERLFDWFFEKMLRYNGEPWAIKIPGQADMIMVTHPDAIEDVTVGQFDNFLKCDFQAERITDLFGGGLVASDGVRWLHQRKAAAKFFSANVLRTAMVQNMQTNVNEMCAVIDRTMDKDLLVDLRQLFHEFTLETFAEIGMGVDLGCIGAANPNPFQKAMDVVAPIKTRRFRLPGATWKPERWLNIGPEAELATHKKILDEWLHGVLTESLENARAAKASISPTKGIKIVVELFVEHSDDSAEGLKPEDLFCFMLTFVVAAHDTTANTLCWLFYALSKNPRIEQNLRAEMDAKLGKDEHAFLTSEHLKTLTYFEATLKETLRLYPAAPFTVRQAIKTTVISGDTLIREGEIVEMSPWAMARHPAVWGPDAAEFKPERWIHPETGQLLQVPLTKFFSFSAGPRTCIGMNLAMLELRIVVANLLHRYTFEIDHTHNDGSYEVAPTLNMKHPLLAKATKIRR